MRFETDNTVGALAVPPKSPAPIAGEDMERILIISGLVAVVLAGAGFALWHHNPTVLGGGFTVSSHHMGESTTEFAKIEANATDHLDDCDGIGRTAKRELCDKLVKYRDAKPEELKNQRVTYTEGGWFWAGCTKGQGRPWEVTFVDGKLSEIHFWPPDGQYVASLEKEYGKTNDVSDQQPSDEERVHGLVVDQTDRISHWEIPVGGKDKVYINIADVPVARPGGGGSQRQGGSIFLLALH